MNLIPDAIKPAHLKRYRDIAKLLLRHGGSDLVGQAGMKSALSGEVPDSGDDVRADAEELTSDLEDLGPTFVKLGQILSSRPDFLPPQYLEVLSRLEDSVEPFDPQTAKEIFEDELGVRVNRAFDTFEDEPVAAASIGQVHRALLRSGRIVAVKIQRPGIVNQVNEDLGAIAEIAGLLDRHTDVGRRYEFSTVVDDLRTAIEQELDYRHEAANLRLFANNLGSFDKLVIPRPIDGLVGRRVLTMDWVHGHKVTELSRVVMNEVAGHELMDELFRAYLQQILIDGVFHADPHPGNVFLTDDHRLALLDLGMTCRVSRDLQQPLLRLLLAIADGRGRDAARVAVEISDLRADFDQGSFEQGVKDLVGRAQNAAIDGMNFGTIVVSVQRIAGDNGVRLPRELRLIGKTLVNMERTATALCPHFEPASTIRKHTPGLLARQAVRTFAPRHSVEWVTEVHHLLDKLPGRLSYLIEVLTNNELKLRVDAIDESRLMTGFQKIANRITVGLVLAAMILAAALMMDTETGFAIFGQPGLAVLLFLFAAVSGVILVVNILWRDFRDRKQRL